MKRGIRLFFTLAPLLITTHRLPAPISEIGTLKVQTHTFLGLQTSSYTCSIQISPDEKTISVEEKRDTGGEERRSQIAHRRAGNSLAWSYEKKLMVSLE
jgi:hypothetical protein